MRSLIQAVCFLLVLSINSSHSDEHDAKTCRLLLRLIDSKSGEQIPGLIQLQGNDGKIIKLPELLDRGTGLSQDIKIHDWDVLAKPTMVHVPSQQIYIKAFSGLETEITNVRLDLRNKKRAEIIIKLNRFYDAHQQGYQSANTHLHLQKIGRQKSDRYLVDVSSADGLDLVFVSYLERAKADLEYTTNKYTPQDLKRLSSDHVHFDHGEEHRHNFTGFGEGYGHVMFLNITELIRPVSLGPGITEKGTDGIPLKSGLEVAQDMGAKIIWCHNHWGLEDIPSWLGGRLHANNIFDGGTHGSYKHSFYRYLNAGIQVPFSTGTDWFMYDFSRVYVPTKKRLSAQEWLERLAAGQSYITNGPLLDFSVNGSTPGANVEVQQSDTVKIVGRAIARNDFQRLELISNGKVIHTGNTLKDEGHFTANIDFEYSIDEPCWLALRTPPPSSDRDPEFQRQTPLNEYGRELFSHTSAVFVNVAGRRVFQLDAVRSLLDEMKRSIQTIEKNALFADDIERKKVLSVYEEGIDLLLRRLEEYKSRKIR